MVKYEIPTKKLNSGYDIPVLGFGTWMGLNDQDVFLSEDVPKMVEALKQAIDIGYRHIDTAHLYRVEKQIGDVVAEKIAAGVVKREELFLTTKLWNHMHAPADVEKALRGSLKRLQTDYVDLFLIHWPMSITAEGKEANIDYLDTWRAMEAVQQAGLARSIGVSNFNVGQLRRLLANCNVVPAMNQIELNLNLGQPELVDFCQTSGIALTAYCPFGTMLPGRSPAGSPEPKTNSPIMVELSKKYGKTATQIALRYLYQRGHISIPKTNTKSRLIENGNIFDFELSNEDIATLAEFENGYRTLRPVYWQDYNNYPLEKISLRTKVEIPKEQLQWED